MARWWRNAHEGVRRERREGLREGVELDHRVISSITMAIRLETSKRRGVDNHQDSEISDSDLRWYRQLSKLHPNAIQRTQPSPLFNCHGLTFASRRSKVLDLTNIFRILEDDAWRETSMTKVLPGDIVIYFDNEGDANHSGVVVQYSQEILVPLICSKWGSGPEYIHKLSDVPNVYGPVTRFYRCHL